MICKEEKDSLKGKYQNIIWAVIELHLLQQSHTLIQYLEKESVLA